MEALPDRLVARNFLALASGEAVARVIAFGATVYVARALGAESFGIIGFALAVVLYFTRIADGGMEFFGLGIREIAEDPTRVETLAPHLMATRLLVSVVLALLIGLVGVLLLPQPDGSILALYGLTLVLVAASTRWIHVGLGHSRMVAVARALGEALMLLLVLLLVRGSTDLARVPLAQLAGDAAAVLLLLAALRFRGHALRLRLDPRVVIPVARRALPLIASALFGLMIYNCDLILLRFFRDTSTVGYYAAAYALISFMLNLGAVYNQSLLPTFTRLGAGSPGRVALYHTSLAQVYAATLPLAVGGCLLAPQLIQIVFGDGYGTSAPALRLLVWIIPLGFFREIATVALVVGGRQRDVLRLTGWSAGVNLVLNLVMIPRFGMIGAALATVVTEVTRTGCALMFAGAAGFRLASPARFWRATVAAIGMAALVILTAPAVLWIGIALGAVTYTVALAGVGGIRFRRNELPALRL